MKTYPVKHIRPDHPSMPKMLKSTNNQLVPVLKASMVTGFGEVASSKISFDQETGLTKAEFLLPHYFIGGDTLEINNADFEGYNKQVRVHTATETTILFDIDGGLYPEELNATIKVAPLGWSLLFENESQNIIILKPDNEMCEVLLRVDNSVSYSVTGSYPNYAKVQMVIDATSIDDYQLISEKKWISGLNGQAWDTGDQTLRPDIVGTKDFVYFNAPIFNNYDSGNAGITMTFCGGVFESEVPQDTFNFILVGGEFSSSLGTSTDTNSRLFKAYDSTYISLAGNYKRVAVETSASRGGEGTYPHSLFGSINVIKNSFDINMEKVRIMESNYIPRGYFPILVTPLCKAHEFIGLTLNVDGRDILILRGYCDTKTYPASKEGYYIAAGYDISPVEV